ncbi:MAG TPA: PQQ-binding-like beta-propeller repeat protein [Gemmataceae bacterium]|nr:PQQ-binding-like beta-propeller repeat protein [Gemmataceae bacterium]
MFNRTACLGVTFLLVVFGVRAEEWPSWRGPRGDGTSHETSIPVRWSANENVRWETPVPGKGHSSPIVWGDRVFVTTCLEKEQKRVLLCLDRRDGKVLWQRVVLTAPLELKHGLNSYASSTPATDGRYVWVSFLKQPEMVVACYDYSGNLIWQRSPGKFYSRHGFCSPPLLYKDLVILNGDHDGDGYLVALDQATGEERWRVDRPNKTRSYCPPVIFDIAGKKQLVMSGSMCVASYDPDTGKELWIIDGPTEQFVASVVQADGVLFMTYGYPKLGVMAIRPDGEGNVTKTHVLYNESRGGGYVPSPIANGHYFFLVNDNGFASCREAKSGKLLWLERLGRHHSASPVSANGHLYFPDDDGTTHVLKAGPKFELVARNALGEECYASPAVSRGQIFIRTLHNLYCIGELGGASKKRSRNAASGGPDASSKRR